MKKLKMCEYVCEVMYIKTPTEENESKTFPSFHQHLITIRIMVK